MTRRRIARTTRGRDATALPAALLLIVSAFQAALALGAPWGSAAYGGAHHGALPRKYRVASAVASLAYVALALVTLDAGSGGQARRRILTGAASLMGVGTVMNLASRSRMERAIWTPVAGALAATLLRAARRT
jgi:hypothetical protein